MFYFYFFIFFIFFIFIFNIFVYFILFHFLNFVMNGGYCFVPQWCQGDRLIVECRYSTKGKSTVTLVSLQVAQRWRAISPFTLPVVKNDQWGLTFMCFCSRFSRAGTGWTRKTAWPSSATTPLWISPAAVARSTPENSWKSQITFRSRKWMPSTFHFVRFFIFEKKLEEKFRQKISKIFMCNAISCLLETEQRKNMGGDRSVAQRLEENAEIRTQEWNETDNLSLNHTKQSASQSLTVHST